MSVLKKAGRLASAFALLAVSASPAFAADTDMLTGYGQAALQGRLASRHGTLVSPDTANGPGGTIGWQNVVGDGHNNITVNQNVVGASSTDNQNVVRAGSINNPNLVGAANHDFAPTIKHRKHRLGSTSNRALSDTGSNQPNGSQSNVVPSRDDVGSPQRVTPAPGVIY